MTRNWINYIDLESVDIYPIQFANSDRLSKHNAVYIFDEVGCGKTISSGIMAMDYLESNPQKDILIITTNALAKSCSGNEYGQFVNDWYEKLPFRQFGYEKRIHIVNNHHSHFSNPCMYGLVIIDEAQLFLNTETQRYLSLVKNIHAQKVVILTATPIKNTKEDLQKYVDIADAVTGKKNDRSWIEQICTNSKERDGLICSMFCPEYPVTRYFKDTVMSLNIDGFQKTEARRCLPCMWKYRPSEKNKDKVMLEKINENLRLNKESKFVIFTRYVDKEAYRIADFLINNGFSKFNKALEENRSAGELTAEEARSVAVVTGENAYQLKHFSGTKGLPTVLILTYQIAEQGVNLPGFNYIVNYHISAFPSALEQRFGRIDRMGRGGSRFKEINMCFMISDEYWDTNTSNFFRAVFGYMKNVISYLPSKNTVLSEEILELYSQRQKLINDYVKGIEEMLTEENINSLTGYLENGSYDEVIPQDLLEFVLEYGIDYDKDAALAGKKLKDDIREELRVIENELISVSPEMVDKYKNIIRKVSDKIFYMHKDTESPNINDVLDSIKTIDAIECGDMISRNISYIQYNGQFKERVKLPVVICNYQKSINRAYERAFIENKFEQLFTFGKDKEILESIISKIDKINNQDRDLILSRAEIVISRLPVYKMFMEFKKIIQGYKETKEGFFPRVKFDFNPFSCAMGYLGYRVKNSTNQMGLTDEFVSTYWTNEKGTYSERYNKYFIIEKNADGIIEASNWYKLAYWYTRREEGYFDCRCIDIGFSNYVDSNTNPQKGKVNIFRDREEYMYYIGELFSECNYDEQEFMKVRYIEKIALSIGMDLRKLPSRKDYTSLFYYYLNTISDYPREYTKEYTCSLIIREYRNPKVYPTDIWTQGIYYELFGIIFVNCVWGNILRLPSECHNIPLFSLEP